MQFDDVAEEKDHQSLLFKNGNVLVVGGNTSPTMILPTATAEIFNASSGTWTTAASLHTAKYNHIAALLNNGGLLVAGNCNSYESSTEVYDVASNSWTQKGNMQTPRCDANATILPATGQVLIAGGINSPGAFLNSSELYDPQTGVWTASGNMQDARAQFVFLTLSNGKILAISSADNAGNAGRLSSEIYDPSNGSWVRTGNLNFPRHWAAASVLPNGFVLISGGTSRTAGNSGSWRQAPPTAVVFSATRNCIRNLISMPN